MKFTCSIDINKPRETVVALFEDPQYLGEYQDGFISKELESGESMQTGAVSTMYYKQGKGQMKLTETILKNELPDIFISSYHHKHMDNTMTCRFETLSNNQTRYTSEIHYTAFRGFLPRILARLFPSMFKKQVQKWLTNFKHFAEKQ